MRDSNKSQTYRAENVVAAALAAEAPVDFYGSTLTLPIERRFASIESVQHYVDAALAHPPVQERWPTVRRRIRVVESRSAVTASYRADTIRVPDTRNRWALREMVIIHELAHHVVACTTRGAVASHGPEFRAAQVELTRMLIGSEAGLLLQHAYDGLT